MGDYFIVLAISFGSINKTSSIFLFSFLSDKPCQIAFSTKGCKINDGIFKVSKFNFLSILNVDSISLLKRIFSISISISQWLIILTLLTYS
jgi:hypothetical protein